MQDIIVLFDTPGVEDCWRVRNAAIFPTPASLRWWWRWHKHEVVKAGAAALVNGRWFAVEPQMSDIVREIGLRDALRAAQAHETPA